MSKIVFIGVCLLMQLCVSLSQFAAAEEITNEKSSTFLGSKNYSAEDINEEPSPDLKYMNHFFGDLRILTYGIILEPAKSSQNPNNNFLQLPHYTATLDVRPDLRFDSSFLELSAKPRGKLSFLIWEDGPLSGETQWKDDWYVNEWLVRVKALDRIFVSYGRENLQWGPSFLYSPSNPFFTDNGRSNPYLEIQGMEFARLVLIPHSLWTISLMVNTDEGRNRLLGPDPFEKTYAVKIDYTGRQNYASLIVSQKDSEKTVGFFGGWTVSDAIIIYGEGSMAKGSRALYPVRDMLLMTTSMQQNRKDDAEIKPVLLAGGSYTFTNGGTFTLEYMHNSPGYTSEEADLYYGLRRDAADAFNMGGIPGMMGAYALSQTVNPGLRFLRKNYAMLQYYQNNIQNRVDVTLRWTQNLDDGSGQFLGILSCSLGQRFEIFSAGTINTGRENTEYGSIFDYQVMFGLKFTL